MGFNLIYNLILNILFAPKVCTGIKTVFAGIKTVFACVTTFGYFSFVKIRDHAGISLLKS